MVRGLRSLSRAAFFFTMFAGALLIALSSLEYFEPNHLAPFVIEKLPVRFEALWKASLKVHVASALLSFPLCLLLITRFLQRRPVAHRWIGRVTGVLVVLLLVPSGVVLSFEAKGGTPVSIGFLLSAGIVLGAMIQGVSSARRGKLATHARAMRHVVGQMSVAVTSRAMLIGLHALGMEPELAYVLALWVPVVGSAAAAEWLSGSFRPSRASFGPFSSRTLS